MSVTTKTTIFVSLALFYICLFTFLGLVPLNSVQVETPDPDSISAIVSGVFEDILNFIFPDAFVEAIFDFITNIFTSISGLPFIMSALIFTPLFVLGAWWFIAWVIDVLPFFGS